MAIRALSRRNGVRAGQREVDRGVVKRRRGPRNRCVALRTVRRKIRCDMVGVGGALEVFQVAGYASCARQVVIVVGVAVGALPRRHSVAAR